MVGKKQEQRGLLGPEGGEVEDEEEEEVSLRQQEKNAKQRQV